MSTAVGRATELASIGEFIDSIDSGPAVLVLEGEPGIGKTTLLQAGVDQADQRGFQVLSCHPSAAEATLSFAALADLLADVTPTLLESLPEPQRQAIDVVLLRASVGSPVLDQRVIGAALLSVLERLAEQTPVLLAIDDLHWLDESSAAVIEFATRRLSSRVAVLAAVRGEESDLATPMFRLPAPLRHQRLPVGPVSLGALHALLRARLGRSFSRPAIVRIEQVSGGNPFYALELARNTDSSGSLPRALPGTLAQLVRARIDGSTAEVRRALLAVAALANPTVEIVQATLDIDAAQVERLLTEAEAADLIRITGHRIGFAHPLLAAGVYTDATPADRRAMHRRLAEVLTEPEVRARHLALAAIRLDEGTVAALDDAARRARARGATTAAAELLELAIGLGADTPERRNSLAQQYFDAGDPARARKLLEQNVTGEVAGPIRAESQLLLATVRLHDDDYLQAADYLDKALAEAGDDRSLRVRILVTLSYVLVNLGRIPDAVKLTANMIADSTHLDDTELVALAEANAAMVRFLGGAGVERAALERILRLPDPTTPTPVMLRPSLIGGMLLAWTGDLDAALDRMLAVRRRCIEWGEESDLMFCAFQTVIFQCWRGNLADARLLAEDTMERATQLGTDIPLAIALATQANVAAYTGQPEQTREAATAALTIFQRGSCLAVTVWPLITIGFLEVSLADCAAAVAAIGPLADAASAMGYGEPMAAPFAADAAEALIGTGQLAQATALVDQLEVNGRRLDRAWALAVGARCRGLLLAAQGDLDGAVHALEQALDHHRRLSMPVEVARTQLAVGQLQRRRRQKRASADALSDAVRLFTEVGAAQWAARATAELDRAVVTPGQGTALTPSEQRVAELAATGRTNREVAAALFISPKTVEANLARVYHKLGIRSRAELGRRMAPAAAPVEDRETPDS
ncbi:MAG TPA: AAA family ATPase [Pseudonocardiaceae bacterium]